VLNRKGEVIAVEYAVLTKFAGSSFGVPIGHALELLEPQKRKASIAEGERAALDLELRSAGRSGLVPDHAHGQR
jgi:hypothetical protein